jgi:protein PhnA
LESRCSNYREGFACSEGCLWNPLKRRRYGSPVNDLKVKGSSSVAKVGTKVKINRLVDGDHNVDCKVTGIGAMMLKSEFVKKA